MNLTRKNLTLFNIELYFFISFLKYFKKFLKELPSLLN